LIVEYATPVCFSIHGIGFRGRTVEMYVSSHA